MSFLNISDIIKCSVARGGSPINIYNVRAWLIHEEVAENSVISKPKRSSRVDLTDNLA